MSKFGWGRRRLPVDDGRGAGQPSGDRRTTARNSRVEALPRRLARATRRLEGAARRMACPSRRMATAAAPGASRCGPARIECVPDGRHGRRLHAGGRGFTIRTFPFILFGWAFGCGDCSGSSPPSDSSSSPSPQPDSHRRHARAGGAVLRLSPVRPRSVRSRPARPCPPHDTTAAGCRSAGDQRRPRLGTTTQ